MESYPQIKASDYKKHFSRSGKYDFYLHPIICDGVVYDIKNNSKLVAFKLLDNGAVKELWSEKLLDFGERKNLDFLQARLEGEILYIVANNGFVLAFDVKSKKIVWKKRFDAVFGASPSLNDENLFLISASDELFAINKQNGELSWKYESENRTSVISAQIPPVSIYQGKIVAGFANGYVAVFDKNGGLIWQNKIVNSKDSTNIIDINDIDFPPILFKDVLVAGGIKSSVMGFDFKSGQPLWQIQTGLNSYIFHNNQGFGFFVNSNNEKVCFFIGNGAIKWVKKDMSFVDEVKVPGYLNGGYPKVITNINRYYDAY